MLFFVACISCITVACDSDDDGTKGDDNKFPAPEVTFSAITGVSFTAGWNALETADSYRYEVSYEEDGQVVAVAAQNTETTTFFFGRASACYGLFGPSGCKGRRKDHFGLVFRNCKDFRR